MANIYEPTEKQIADWKQWVAERPDAVRKVAERFEPWKLYRLTTTDQRCTLVSFGEDGTVRIDVSSEFNLLTFSREVFGIDPDTLVECDLPALNEVVGEMFNEKQTLDFINAGRAQHGLPPMAALTDEEAAKRYGDGKEILALYKLGTDLSAEDQAYVLRAYVHRYTGENEPAWVKANKHPPGYRLQFKGDAEWLANSRFRVTAEGRLHKNTKQCESTPTWPYNPELRERLRPKLDPGPRHGVLVRDLRLHPRRAI